MNLFLGLIMGVKEIWAHKFRSFLTMLGIILGVASLLSMFSLSAGMARGMREYMTQIGGIELVGVISQEGAAPAGVHRRDFSWSHRERRGSHRPRLEFGDLRVAGRRRQRERRRWWGEFSGRNQGSMAGLPADQ
jgi:hypothetical protein